MNLIKFVYVSPQYFNRSMKQWNYEYIRNGEFFRTRSFGYHEGKEVIRQLEIDAWLNDQRLRKLNQFQWRDLRYTLLGGKYTDQEGNKLIFNSKVQLERFQKEINRTDAMVKVLRQLPGEEIVLQHVYQDGDHHLGYLKIIGKRGGTKTEHGYSVGFAAGEPYLTRRIGPLFEAVPLAITDKEVLP